MRSVLISLRATGAILASVLVWIGTPLGVMILDLAGLIVLSSLAWKAIQGSEHGDASGGRTHALTVLRLDLFVAWPMLGWSWALLAG